VAPRITEEDFDRAFETGEDLDTRSLPPGRVNVDFPACMVDGFDARATQRGITRQALIKMWIAEESDERGMASKRIHKKHYGRRKQWLRR
jgi:hypothetical protein